MTETESRWETAAALAPVALGVVTGLFALGGAARNALTIARYTPPLPAASVAEVSEPVIEAAKRLSPVAHTVKGYVRMGRSGPISVRPYTRGH